LIGVTFSDRFLARYSPPQVQIIHFQSDADGQLSLLDFEVQSVDEPPDPDDFESLDAFREALALWDCEHNEVSPEHNENIMSRCKYRLIRFACGRIARTLGMSRSFGIRPK
jgi:hypothetical protein